MAASSNKNRFMNSVPGVAKDGSVILPSSESPTTADGGRTRLRVSLNFKRAPNEWTLIAAGVRQLEGVAVNSESVSGVRPSDVWRGLSGVTTR